MLLISLLVFDFIPLSHLCTDCLSSKKAGFLLSTSFYIHPRAVHCRPESQRAGGLILFDKRSLWVPYAERERAGTNVDRHKIFLKDLQNHGFCLHSLSPSIPCCHHFIRPLSLSQLPLQREARGSERGGGIVYLTLICSVVSFGEMTGNLGGKGQLFLSLLFRGPIYRPWALLPPHLPKLQTISGCGMLLWVHSCGQGLKEETPSRSLSPSPFPGSLNFIRPSLSASFSLTAL